MNTESVTTEISFDGKSFQQLYVYEIRNLCDEMVRALLESDKPDEKHLKDKYNNEYANKCTRFSPSVEFCIHELHMMIKDPLCLGNGEVLASNGKRAYLISEATFNSEGFDVTAVTKEDIGRPVLNDETVGYDPNITNLSLITKGIVDSDGYVDSSFVGSITSLGEIVLMDKLFSDKALYEDYIANRVYFSSPLEFITSKPNCIAIAKENERYKLRYVSENDGKVQNFIDTLEQKDLIEENLPLILPEVLAPMATQEIDLPMKKAV